jgi:hypothetical protein
MQKVKSKVMSRTDSAEQQPAATSRTLSSNIMQLKFMQRKREAELKAAQKVEQEEAEKSARWTLESAASSSALVLVLPLDEGAPEASLPGRRSFGKFNLAIEKLEKEKLASSRNFFSARASDVPVASSSTSPAAPRNSADAEWAERYSTYILHQQNKRPAGPVPPEMQPRVHKSQRTS